MQGKEIRIFSDKVDMHTAQRVCEQNGGKLFEPQSATEMNAILHYYFENIWIGIHDKTSEGHFTYMDGRQISYTNWAHGEPNNYDVYGNGGGEDCVEAWGNYGGHNHSWGYKIPPGKWNDVPCSLKLAFVCEEPTFW